MAQQHTLKAYDQELAALRALISRMGGLAEAQIEAAVEALLTRDAAMAAQVVADDEAIDALEAEAEQRAIQTIALRAPLADDLREIVAALKIASILERMGDYAKNIAKRATVVSRSASSEPMAILPQMAAVTTRMTKDVLDAYVARDAAKAMGVWERDRDVDDLYNSLFRELLTYMMENPRMITPSTHLLFIAKNLERIGDHATNLAEIVYYIATGETMDIHGRPKGDDTAFADITLPTEGGGPGADMTKDQITDP